MRNDLGVWLAYFQIVALPAVLLLLAWIVRPTRREVESAATKDARARKRIDRYRWLSRKLLIPPLGYFVSGGLSLALPAFSMVFLGITTFLEAWFFVFLIAFNTQRSQSEEAG